MAAATFPLPCVLRLAGGGTCIAFAAGRKHLHAVAMGTPIALVSLPLGAPVQPAEWKRKPYPVRRAARIYLRSEISKTDRAKRVLRAIAKGETEVRT